MNVTILCKIIKAWQCAVQVSEIKMFAAYQVRYFWLLYYKFLFN